MSTPTIFINVFAFGCLIFALIKDRRKAIQALAVALKSFLRVFPTVLIIIIFIGLLLGFVPQSQIAKIAGGHAGLGGVLIVAVLGAILYIPSLVAFPLAAAILKSGASITSIAVFITTLTMIGVVTLPLEIKELGKKIAILRNVMSFVIAIVIGVIMGAIL